MHRVLRVPKRELRSTSRSPSTTAPYEVFTGYRVHHNLNRGPATGGIRYIAGPDLDLVRAIAMLNTWKAALLEVPLAGRWAAWCQPAQACRSTSAQGLTRRYATEISP